jgi:AmpD protein
LPEGSYEGSNVEDFFLNKLSISDHNSFDEIKDLKVSSHLYIKRNGELVQFVPFNKRAWHAGESTYKGVSDCNNYSIGIELEGTDDYFYTDDQYDTLTEATKGVIKNYPLINKDSIVGHSDVSPGRKTDPGRKFDWGRFLEAL